MTARIAVLTSGGSAPAMIVNALAAAFDDLTVMREPPEPRAVFLRRRARRLGWPRVAGQLPMMVGARLSKRLLDRRFAEIAAAHAVSMTWPEAVPTIDVPPANDQGFIAALEEHAPDLLFIIGARMLTRATLERLPCPAINFHAGITPDYRGVNGGYWAIANGRPERYGGTVHVVDAGVDTGKVIAQKICKPDPRDTIFTHHHALTAQCADLCVAAVDAALAGRVMDPQPQGASHQHYHPTLWGWIATGLRRRAW